MLSYSTLLGLARLSRSGGWVAGWVRKAGNKAKAQHSWGWSFAELGNRTLTPHTPKLRDYPSQKVGHTTNPSQVAKFGPGPNPTCTENRSLQHNSPDSIRSLFRGGAKNPSLGKSRRVCIQHLEKQINKLGLNWAKLRSNWNCALH